MQALVTGANRGLGLEVTKQLVDRGFAVWAGVRDAAKMPELGDRVSPLRLDVADPRSIARARAELDSLDVLVNNAAIIGAGDGPVLDCGVEAVRVQIETNAFGPWRLVCACADLLRASPRGRVVNVSSSAASLATMTDIGAAYLTSKLALNGMTRMLADALRDDGVLVNAVCPGWLDTEMGASAGPGGRPVSEGAAAVLWAATLPDNGPSGGFFEEGGRVVPW